jgi:hypothetical protein
MTHNPLMSRDTLGVDLRDNAPMTETQFWFAMCQRFARENVTPDEAGKYAADTLRAYLRDEKIAFGDPSYAWDRHAARTIAEQYEIDHWERQA